MTRRISGTRADREVREREYRDAVAFARARRPRFTGNERSPANPFIAAACSHYPERFAVGSTAGRADCDCADCFYCDGDS